MLEYLEHPSGVRFMLPKREEGQRQRGERGTTSPYAFSPHPRGRVYMLLKRVEGHRGVQRGAKRRGGGHSET
jgi:hypothetical protein